MPDTRTPTHVIPWLIATLLIALTCGPTWAVGISWEAVDGAGGAIDLYRNSHCTATAWMARHHGLRNSGETDQRLVATAWVYLQHCECDKPGSPTIWKVADGLGKMFEARNRTAPTIRERCRTSSNASERASFADYSAAIDAGRPVTVTFCYDSSSANGLAAAARREKSCFSAVGIGYMKYGDQLFLICRHGATTAEMGPAAQDVVNAAALGINTAGKPWGESGTSLIKWNGASKNVVLVFVGG